MEEKPDHPVNQIVSLLQFHLYQVKSTMTGAACKMKQTNRTLLSLFSGISPTTTRVEMNDTESGIINDPLVYRR